MKRYIRSSYAFDPWKNADLSEWSDADIYAWNSTDWKSRNYDPLYVYDDSFVGTLYIYGLPEGVVTEPVTFVKELHANTIYSPKYVVPDWYHSDVYKKYKADGITLLTPSVEHTTRRANGVTYYVADRAETQELYDKLSR